jgi:hypothetical protein
MIHRAHMHPLLGAVHVKAAIMEGADRLPKFSTVCRSQGTLNVTAALHVMRRTIAESSQEANELACVTNCHAQKRTRSQQMRLYRRWALGMGDIGGT